MNQRGLLFFLFCCHQNNVTNLDFKSVCYSRNNPFQANVSDQILLPDDSLGLFRHTLSQIVLRFVELQKNYSLMSP
jgi:hypothetical protein